MAVELLSHSSLLLPLLASNLCTGKDKEVKELKTLILNKENLMGSMSISPKKGEEFIGKHILKKGKYDPLNPPHESVLEHLVYTFFADISRACLQELSRHRIASPSVESTRYALKKILKKEKDVRDFVYLTGNEEVDNLNIAQVESMVKLAMDGISNDVLKYCIPEAFMSRELLTINARSLRNFMLLRTSSRALDEIRRLAFDMYDVLPVDHKFIFEDRLSERKFK